MVELLGGGGVLCILSWVFRGSAKVWFDGIGLLALAAGLVVFLVGFIAERKEWEFQSKSEMK